MKKYDIISDVFTQTDLEFFTKEDPNGTSSHLGTEAPQPLNYTSELDFGGSLSSSEDRIDSHIH